MVYLAHSHNVLSFRGEHLLLFLVQTVARQTVEHCQYRPPRIREDRNRKTASPEGERLEHFFLTSVQSQGFYVCLTHLFFSDSDMPDHDLEPPRFAQLALERVLQDWNALRSMIMFGSQENKDPYVSVQTLRTVPLPVLMVLSTVCSVSF